MNIVFDLDNTVAVYDELILDICNELNIKIPFGLYSKSSISQYLKSTGQNRIWTEVQGVCYGPRMRHAKVAPGFYKFAERLKKHNFKLILVSHKTQFPASGLNFDLRLSAKSWLDENLTGVFDEVHFEGTSPEKISKIKKFDPLLLVDDLACVLLKSGLGKDRSILIHNSIKTFETPFYHAIPSWDGIMDHFNFD